jgi:Tfp pilus assembly protein PilX
MGTREEPRGVPLPPNWPRRVKSALLHIITLAQYVAACTHSWAVNSRLARLRLKAENGQLKQEAALRAKEMRIKNARLRRVDPQKRPHYAPTERMAILELRAARGWSVQQTADAFRVTATTITSWMRRLDEEGADALGQIAEPVNKFPATRSHHFDTTVQLGGRYRSRNSSRLAP